MNTGTAVVGVALIGAAGVLAYLVYKKSQTTISISVGGVTLGSATTNALANAGVTAVSSSGNKFGQFAGRRDRRTFQRRKRGQSGL